MIFVELMMSFVSSYDGSYEKHDVAVYVTSEWFSFILHLGSCLDQKSSKWF